MDVQTPEVPRMPQLVMGAASPLWGYFGAAALGGVAYWWMTRWARPANLESLFEAAVRASGGSPAREPADPPAPAVALQPPALAAEPPSLEVEPPTPVGGESAPISPLTAAVEPEPRAIPEPEPSAAPTPPADPVNAKPRRAASPPADA